MPTGNGLRVTLADDLLKTPSRDSVNGFERAAEHDSPGFCRTTSSYVRGKGRALVTWHCESHSNSQMLPLSAGDARGQASGDHDEMFAAVQASRAYARSSAPGPTMSPSRGSLRRKEAYPRVTHFGYAKRYIALRAMCDHRYDKAEKW